jgi:GDPmannose 4,6-dehydratase
VGTIALLEAIRSLQPKTRLFHASSSLIFGQPDQSPQDESTPYRPDNPYAASKAMATQMVSIHRKTYGLFAVNGICYNHESPRRGPDFVTGKICRAAASIAAGSTHRLMLGNIHAQRDWSDARDFVAGFWSSLQAEVPDDYVFASGRTTSSLIRGCCAHSMDTNSWAIHAAPSIDSIGFLRAPCDPSSPR